MRYIYGVGTKEVVTDEDRELALERAWETCHAMDYEASEKAGKPIETNYPASVTFKIKDGYLGFEVDIQSKPIERIRRITGYLTGTLDRFNDAKKAEERDRVKHG